MCYNPQRAYDDYAEQLNSLLAQRAAWGATGDPGAHIHQRSLDGRIKSLIARKDEEIQQHILRQMRFWRKTSEVMTLIMKSNRDMAMYAELCS